MYKVGVTGGIGSGKSLVCEIFRKMGVPVYAADSEARRIMGEDPEIREALTGKFGPQTYGEYGLDRKFLADRIFGDSEARSFVNSLVHPKVWDDFTDWALRQEGPYVIEEAALLFESGAWKELDFNILVQAGEEQRIERIMKRDGIGRGEVLARFASQIDPEKAANMADFRIHNDENEFLIPQVLKADRIIRKLTSG